MTASKFWADYAVKLHRLTAESGGAVYVDGVKSASVSSGIVTLVEGSDGALLNTFGSLQSAEPRATFTTTDLKAILDVLTDFSAIDSDGTHPGVAVYGHSYASGASRSTANAQEYLFDQGMMVLRSLEMSHGGNATVTVEIIGESSDGSTSPVTFDEAATLPAASAKTDVLWTLGKVDLGTFNLEGVESVSIDFGVQEFVEARDSDEFKTFVSARKQQMTITIRAAHIDATASITEGGLYASSGVILWAKKRAEGGTYVADGTAEHVSFSLGKARIDWRQIQGDPKMIEVVVTPWDTEGGTAPYTIDTAAAIV